MKATAIAPANIAFIKYWGKRDDAFRLPLNSSISMNLSACTTMTTVEFSPEHQSDDITFLQPEERPLTTITRPCYVCQRITQHLDRLRQRAGIKLYAKVVTRNTFPEAAGIASSASGFAALTVAAVEALGLTLSEKELTILARFGSGSACRSIPDGFVEWLKGKSSQTSYAYSFYPHDHWDLRDIVVVVQTSQKKTGSTEGMDKVRTSPFWDRRVRDIPDRIKRVKHALVKKDFEELGEAMEEDCLDMHAVMQSQKPPLYYLTEETHRLMDAVRQWRQDSIAVYFTIDAGPNVHLICEAKDEKIVLKKASEIIGVQQIIVNKPSRGAHVINNHLF